MKKLLILMFIALPFGSEGQDTLQRNWSLNGYVTNMQSFVFQKFDGDWMVDNLIHNRLNFKWHNRTGKLNAVLELRNRFISGESVQQIPGYAQTIKSDKGSIDLSANLLTGSSCILNSRIDRAYFDYSRGKFQLRIGRQRINWGQCFTWNPNDIFNAYSFFDFDYIEKPGADAIRLQYYPGNTSGFDAAIKVDNQHKITSAVLYHFNKRNYDIQFLGGIFNQTDYVIGAGWSGSLWNASFRGEVSYFQPQHNDTTGVLVISLGSEYAFKNAFMLQIELLYDQDKTGSANSFTDFSNISLSAKDLSFSTVSLMIQGSYPVTPLFNVSVAGIVFPGVRGFFISPSLSCSIADNFELSLITQSFAGQFEKGHTSDYHAAYLRLKWNF